VCRFEIGAGDLRELEGGASEVGEERVKKVVGLEPTHSSRGGVFVAMIDRVLQTSPLDLSDFVRSLHKAKGVSDDLVLRAVMAVLDLPANESSRLLGIVISMVCPMTAKATKSSNGSTRKVRAPNPRIAASFRACSRTIG
jgi:hypothetical protein